MISLQPGLRFLLLFFFVGWLSDPSLAQNGQIARKTFDAVRTTNPPDIDGSLADEAWAEASPASGFFQYDPHNDRAAGFETVVRVLYDDKAIYIGAMLYDPYPDSLLTELGLRDSGEQLNADRFWIDINPFNDGINGFRFQVSSSGVQTDVNMSGAGTSGGGFSRGDNSWDAVWGSAVKIIENAWVVEMEIPYSALRFPREEVHEWGINFWREIRRTRETSSWNFVDRRIGDVMASMGVMTGIEGIKPPLRLALFPYVASYLEKNGSGTGWTGTYNGGMDIKLGLSPAFTMDMTLIPDFGQVQSDAKVLNLSPFEVKYDENRQFFTEGTELFSKADLFYSRRIGATPRKHDINAGSLQPGEIISDNPLETRMINATKLSGRTSSGLGIGIFNAMTAASHATIRDTLTNATREITTQPFTNYNLVVVDQSLRNNSFVSLINTNVTGSETGYVANVTGTEFRLLDKSNMFRISGNAAMSQQYHRETDNQYGFKYAVGGGKVGGTWRYSYSRNVISDSYDQNDMGFLRSNNEVENSFSISHNIFVPFRKFLNLTNSLNLRHSKLYKPNTFTGMDLEYSLRALFRSRFFITLDLEYEPLGQRDYFEPRVPGRFYETGKEYSIDFSYSTDYRKRAYLDGEISFRKVMSEHNQSSFNLELEPTFRMSNQLNISAGFEYNNDKNDIGYVKRSHPDSVYFGLRQSPTIVNTLSTTYIFTNTLSLDFSLRHYWSRAIYDGEYFFLKPNGRLQTIAEDLHINDISYNAFTIDMKITWNFAPGSQLTLVWKNIIDNSANDLPDSYLDNISRVFDLPQINSLSVKFLYYLDYQTIQRLKRNR